MPHSSGYYHLNQTYWAHGAPSQLGNNIPTLPAFNYGVDGEGRINTVSASVGQNPVTGVTYNSASLPTQVTFGSADTDIFAYDSNTLRTNQFQFNVGTTPQSLKLGDRRNVSCYFALGACVDSHVAWPSRVNQSPMTYVTKLKENVPSVPLFPSPCFRRGH